MRLDYAVSGDSLNPKLLVLHGFTGTRDSFAHLEPELGRCRQLVRLDLPGHALAPLPAPGLPGWHETVAALCALVDELTTVSTIDVLGYSQGARIALAVALSRPQRIGRLILESGSPGIKDDAQRALRRAADEALAQQLEHGGIEPFIQRWEARPMFEGLSQLPQPDRDALYARRRSHTARGLAAALRSLSVGVQPSYWDDLASLNVPALLMTGEHDTKFTDVAHRMAAFLPRARPVVLGRCGHAAHLEQSAYYTSYVMEFLNEN